MAVRVVTPGPVVSVVSVVPGVATDSMRLLVVPVVSVGVQVLPGTARRASLGRPRCGLVVLVVPVAPVVTPVMPAPVVSEVLLRFRLVGRLVPVVRRALLSMALAVVPAVLVVLGLMPQV